MIAATTVMYLAASVVFSVAALFAVIHVVRGPTIIDRVIGSDVLLTTLMLVVGAEMVINNHTTTIPIIVVLAATAAFSTIAVARYVTRQDEKGRL